MHSLAARFGRRSSLSLTSTQDRPGLQFTRLQSTIVNSSRTPARALRKQQFSKPDDAVEALLSPIGPSKTESIRQKSVGSIRWHALGLGGVSAAVALDLPLIGGPVPARMLKLQFIAIKCPLCCCRGPIVLLPGNLGRPASHCLDHVVRCTEAARQGSDDSCERSQLQVCRRSKSADARCP